jgi:putative salt-induced outer membrane protein YdiY
MKTILAAVVTLVMTSAFAHEGNHKHMITFDNLESNVTNDRSFDISFADSEDDSAGTENNSSNVALNYTYAINGAWQVGGAYQNNGTKTMTGVHAFYNLDGKVMNTCFVGVHYKMTDIKATEDEATTIALEYGHRFAVGSWMGLHLAFSPSVSYSMTSTDIDADDSTDKDSALAWNFLKFDVLF